MKKFTDKYTLTAFLEKYHLSSLLPNVTINDVFLREFEKDEMIYHAGEEITIMYIVIEGKVKIFSSTSNDKRLLLRIHKAPIIIGEIEYFHKNNVLNSVEASTDCTAIAVPYQVVKEKLINNPLFLQRLLETIADKFRTKANASTLNTLYPVEVRFASYLLAVTKSEDTTFQQEMKLSSITDISEMIGTSYRHLNRVIQKLCQENIIEKEKRKIKIIDYRKLREIAKDNVYE